MVEKIQEKVILALEAALKQWHRQEATATLDEALPHVVRQTKTAWSGDQPVLPHQLVNHILFDLLEELASADDEAATLLRRRYIDDQTGFAVANSLGISESVFYRRRREALTRLADIAHAREQAVRATLTEQLESRLKLPSYHQLIGLDDLRQRLRDLICQQSDIRLICLAGIGGIGKTSLADALARDIIAGGCFDDLAWISAQQQQFAPWGEIQETGQPALTADELVTRLYQQLSDGLAPPRPPAETLAALKTRLATKPHLIIVDNLETVADYEAVLPRLQALSRSAWIIVTSRVAIHDRPDVHLVNLTELNQTDAEALIRAEAFRRGIHDLAEAPVEAISRIYEIAGGNPLALKLIIGQVQILSLSIVLTDFSEARGQRVEALYDYIYRQAWDLLDETAQRVLLTMPLVATPGTTQEHLLGVTGLEYDALNQALDRLIRLSLVDVGGPLTERRYSIHRLTETFLHKQVTKWTEQMANGE